MEKITRPTKQDIIKMYWNQTESIPPVFYTKSLINGLLEFVSKDSTQGFNRMILEHKINS